MQQKPERGIRGTGEGTGRVQIHLEIMLPINQPTPVKSLLCARQNYRYLLMKTESWGSAELFPIHLLASSIYTRDNVRAAPSSRNGLISNSELRTVPSSPFLACENTRVPYHAFLDHFIQN